MLCLTNCHQRVAINIFSLTHYLSFLVYHRAASILGSLLLFVYINDMVEYICHSLLLISADDTNWHKHIDAAITDYNTLQEDIICLFTWCGDSDLNLNLKKCVHPSFKHKIDTTYILFEIPCTIPCNMCYKDLGIILSSDPSGINHYKFIIAHV